MLQLANFAAYLNKVKIILPLYGDPNLMDSKVFSGKIGAVN
jgi:hypothetical protein